MTTQCLHLLSLRVFVVCLALVAMQGAAGCEGAPKGPGGWVPLSKPPGQTLFVHGVYKPGSDVSEPRPAESRFLRTDSGGILVVDAGAGFFLKISVREPLKKSLYVRVEYEDPERPPAPSVNDAVLHPADQGFVFSSPGVYRGLKGYADYSIKVLIFNSREDAQPIDTLVQPIRCYVDTTTDQLKIWSHVARMRRP